MVQAGIGQNVPAYMVANHFSVRPDLRVDPNDSLRRDGVLDSLGVTKFIGFIEETFCIAVEQEKEAADRRAHFGTINVNSHLVLAKRSDA